MKIGFKPLVTALLVAVLVVPAAAAKPGGSHGKGGGKPAWAGGGRGHEKAAVAHEKRAKKDKGAESESAVTEGEATTSATITLEGKNPAWKCKNFHQQMAEQFAAMFGSEANAYGKCVSSEARKQGEDAAQGELEQGLQQKSAALDLEALADLNPSQYCGALQAWLTTAGADFGVTFAATFGTNANKANSHGKCASRRAHGEDLAAVAQQAVSSAATGQATQTATAPTGLARAFDFLRL